MDYNFIIIDNKDNKELYKDHTTSRGKQETIKQGLKYREYYRKKGYDCDCYITSFSWSRRPATKIVGRLS